MRIPADKPPPARAGLRHGRHVHDRHRGHHRLDRHAADRGPARRPAPLRLGLLVLPAHADRYHGGVRQAGRPLRATAGAARRDRGLPRRLAPVRGRLVDAVPDRLPAGPGDRRRRHPAGGPHRRRRPLSRARAWPDPGLSRQRLGRVFGPRPPGRRAHRPAPRLALDLLDQRAGRPRRGGGLPGASCGRTWRA